nr:MAG TPA: zipper dimerization domain transcription factor-like protein [Caudoviricetes sp.]
MPKITIASLERRIMVLESEKQTLGGQLSINGEYNA